MNDVEQLLRSAGFEPEIPPPGARPKFTKPGTSYQATLGMRNLRLIRVDGHRVEDVHLVASVDHGDTEAIVAALSMVQPAAFHRDRARRAGKANGTAAPQPRRA